MELVSDAWDVLAAGIVWGIGLFVALKISSIFRVNWRRSIFLYIWHTVFCVLYAYYVIFDGGDAIGYYESSVSSGVELAVGTGAVVLFTRLFSYYLDLSFLGVFFVYNIFGFIGLIAFDASLAHACREKARAIRLLATLSVCLPSVSFWSSAIGKDSISFMAVGLALWAAVDFNRRVRLMIFSIVLMFLVRPHIAGLMIIAAAVSIVASGRSTLGRKAVLIVLFLGSLTVAIPFAIEYSGLGVVGAEDFFEFVDQRQSYNQEGGGGIDISEMNPAMQLFSYAFRPLLFEASSIFSLASAFDNAVLIIIFVAGGFGFLGFRRLRRHKAEENIVFMWVYSLSAWTILAITTSNLGISVRQKWMFVPILVYLLISNMPSRIRFRHINDRIVR